MILTFAILLPLLGLLALGVAYVFYRLLHRWVPTDESHAAHASQIRRSVMVFLKREGLVFLAVAVVAVLALIRWVTIETALTFATGSLLSSLTVFIAAHVGIRTSGLTVKAASVDGYEAGLDVSFSGATVCGLVGTSLSLICLSTLYYLTIRGLLEPIDMAGFVLGATSVSLFSRLAGAVFSKSAELTTHLVSRVEPGISKHDRRNPAGTASEAGEQIGNLCGAASELFEACAAAVVATLLIASSGASTIINITGDNRTSYMSLPVIVAGIGLGASVLALLIRLLLKKWEAGGLFRFCQLVGSVVLLAGSFLAVNALELEIGVFYALLLGVISTLVVGLLTEWYTSGPPVRRIAEASKLGSVTNILAGLTVGLQSTALPVLTISGAVLIAYNYAGIYGIGIAAVGMLGTVAIVFSVAAFGPIMDGAASTAHVSTGDERSALAILNRLHLTGGATAAVGKSLIVSASALAALALLAAYARLVGLPSLDIVNPTVVVGFFLGGILPFYISDAVITSIGKASFAGIQEARRQFEQLPGLREGRELPDTRRYAIIGTWSALKEMVLPLFACVVSPIAVGQILGRATLGGMLAGALLTAVLLALFMIHAGSAWDNTQKHLEQEGRLSGEEYRAAEVGLQVGNPFKDACGPAVTILVRLMAIVALVIAPLLR